MQRSRQLGGVSPGGDPITPAGWRAHWGGHHDVLSGLVTDLTPAGHRVNCGGTHRCTSPEKWEGTLRVEHHEVDDQGYDARGSYFGIPDTVYHVTCDEGDVFVDFFIRAGDPVHAIEVARRCYPAAQIHFDALGTTQPPARGHGQPSPYSDDAIPDTRRAGVHGATPYS